MRKIITITLCALLCLALCACCGGSDTNSGSASSGAASSTPVSAPSASGEEFSEGISLGHGLEILEISGYTGAYMEDGSDEQVKNVLMLRVANAGREFIQYAEITMGQAVFTLSTLMPGETCLVLEQNRMTYNGGTEWATPTAQNVATFREKPTLCEDKLRIQTLDGCLNITNVSGADIDGDVVIYYKNYANGTYYGGITYRVRIAGGMKADEIKQLMVSHFNMDSSKIVFVTVG